MSFDFSNERVVLKYLANALPDGCAYIQGSLDYPDIKGVMNFYQMPFGVYVVYSLTGLPTQEGKCGNRILALHIHDGSGCTGNEKDPFADAGSHYNPSGCPHPEHAGDLPPIFVNDGYAFGAVFTHRFNVSDVLGKPVIIHSKPDDFKTQPSGNSGDKIACGIIRKM